MRAIFLDRDGVINEKASEGDYVKSWQEFVLLPAVPGAIRLLNRSHFKVIVVTNQRGIGRGIMKEQGLQDIHQRLLTELERLGARIDAIYYCPHREGECHCRKPDLGLFHQAQRDFPGIVLKESFVIGDSWRDMEAGMKLGCRNILIEHGQGTMARQLQGRKLAVDGVARSLREAVKRFVVPEERSSSPL